MDHCGEEGQQSGCGQRELAQLNANNTATDRATVIGNKCLNISDKVAFTRQVYQKIASTTRVPITDGYYSIKVKVKSGCQFNQLYVYAKSAGQTFKKDMLYDDSKWHTVKLDSIVVKKGSVEVGFMADAPANAWCHIDDLELVRKADLPEQTAVKAVMQTVDSGRAAYYAPDGRRLPRPQKGINIVRTTVDGKTVTCKTIQR